MPRPRKFRRVCCMPAIGRFGPLGCGEADSLLPPQTVQMSVEEYETIRLMDLEGCTQEECALQMGIARTTVQGIYNGARKKMADVLVHGKCLDIEGGNYMLCENFESACGHGCQRQCPRKNGGKINE